MTAAPRSLPTVVVRLTVWLDPLNRFVRALAGDVGIYNAHELPRQVVRELGLEQGITGFWTAKAAAPGPACVEVQRTAAGARFEFDLPPDALAPPTSPLAELRAANLLPSDDDGTMPARENR